MGQEQLRRAGLVVLVALVSLASLVALLLLLESYLPGAEKYKDIADLVQTALTILALLGGGAFAAYKLELFRDFEPHLTISHTINHRPVGNSYVHIDIAVSMRNGSKVKVELHEGFWTLQQISPLTDPEAEEVYSRRLDEDLPEFPWPVLDEGLWKWSRDDLVIEPGETHHELLEIIVPDEVETMLIYTFCYDPRVREQDIGWSLATVFDTIN